MTFFNSNKKLWLWVFVALNLAIYALVLKSLIFSSPKSSPSHTTSKKRNLSDSAMTIREAPTGPAKVSLSTQVDPRGKFEPLAKNPFRAYGLGVETPRQEIKLSPGTAKPDFSLKGIFFDGADSAAIVELSSETGSKKVKVGETVGETKILEIRKDEVIAQKGGNRFRITTEEYQEIK